MMKKPEWILGSSENDQVGSFHKVLSIYGQILNNQKIYNEKVKIAMKQHIQTLETNSLFMNNR